MSTITEATVQELISALPNTTILNPTSKGYEKSLERWSLFVRKRPGLVVYPRNSEEVSKAIVFSTKHGLAFVIVGGGHSTGGASLSEGGVQIDLKEMRKVTVDVAAKTVTAEGGCLWGDVDAATAPHGLACVGGTVSHTGIGGLTTGGGLGWLTGVHGMVVDNLLEVEIVLADGKITTASVTQNPDLFWAIKGAGASFGAITKFTYRAHDQKTPVWAGAIIVDISNLAKVIEIANRVIQIKAGNAGLLMAIVSPPPAHVPAICCWVFYNGSEAEAMEYFGPLLEMNPFLNTAAEVPYPQSNTVLNPFMPHGGRVLMKGSAFIPPLEVSYVEDLVEEYKAHIKEYPEAVGTAMMFECLPFAKTKEVPLTETAYANRGAYCNMLFASRTDNTALDNVCRQWNRKMADKNKVVLNKRKSDGVDGSTAWGVGEYVNYDGLNDSGETLYGVNYKRLHSLKKIYDPTNAFTPGGLLG